MTTNNPVYLLIVGEAPGPTEMQEQELNGMYSVFSPLSRSGKLIRGIIDSTLLELPGSVVPGYINGYNMLPRDGVGHIRKPTREEFDSTPNMDTIRRWVIDQKPVLFVGKAVWEHLGRPEGNHIRVVPHPSYQMRFGYGHLGQYKDAVKRCIRELTRPGGPAPQLRLISKTS
jgi:hypothetical protein